MNATRDKYDDAVEYLTAHPSDIRRAWDYPHSHSAGCLFLQTGSGCTNGCLTQIRANLEYRAPKNSITKAIRADARIPMNPADIDVGSLPVFAEWQRRLDKELSR
jgi:hypothetical protein